MQPSALHTQKLLTIVWQTQCRTVLTTRSFQIAVLQVGLCAPSAASAAPGTTASATAPSPSSRYTSPARSTAVTPSPSKFGPASSPSVNPESVELVDLHSRAGIVVSSAVNSSSSSRNSSSTGTPADLGSSSRGLQEQQQQWQEQQQPGRFLVPVTLWPCARLARGVALLSKGAWSSLVQPEAGGYLALYEPQDGKFLLTVQHEIDYRCR